MHTTASSGVPAWVRIGLVALGVPNALAGGWAIFAPQGWYDSFPGWDPRLVAADPPYNAHLVTDAGAGLLASGLVLLAAAWLADVRSVRLGLVAFAAFAIPHAAFHVLNPSDGLTDAQDLQNAGVLVFTVVAAAVLFVASGRRQMAHSGSDG
jgi:hypothetical protein